MHRQLRYEFVDTLLSMGIGWMINSAMIILAAAVFFSHGIAVTELEQAEELLRPLIGPAAGTILHWPCCLQVLHHRRQPVWLGRAYLPACLASPMI